MFCQTTQTNDCLMKIQGLLDHLNLWRRQYCIF